MEEGCSESEHTEDERPYSLVEYEKMSKLCVYIHYLHMYMYRCGNSWNICRFVYNPADGSELQNQTRFICGLFFFFSLCVCGFKTVLSLNAASVSSCSSVY